MFVNKNNLVEKKPNEIIKIIMVFLQRRKAECATTTTTILHSVFH